MKSFTNPTLQFKISKERLRELSIFTHQGHRAKYHKHVSQSIRDQGKAMMELEMYSLWSPTDK